MFAVFRALLDPVLGPIEPLQSKPIQVTLMASHSSVGHPTITTSKDHGSGLLHDAANQLMATYNN